MKSKVLPLVLTVALGYATQNTFAQVPDAFITIIPICREHKYFNYK